MASVDLSGSYTINDAGWGDVPRGPVKIVSASKPYPKRKGQSRQSKRITLANYGDPEIRERYYYHPEQMLDEIADIIKLPKKKLRPNPGDEDLRNLEQQAQLGDSDALERLKTLRKRLGFCAEHGLVGCEDCNPESLVWDPFENLTRRIADLKEQQPELTDKEAFALASTDDGLDLYDFEWFCNTLSEWMDDLGGDDWVAIYRGGRGRWFERKNFRASNGLSMLREVVHERSESYTIRRWKNRKYLEFTVQGTAIYQVYPETIYTLSENPDSWAYRGERGEWLSTPSYADVNEKALPALEAAILAKWDYVTLETVRDGDRGDCPIGGSRSGTTGDEELIAEIDDFVEENWQRILVQTIGPPITGYHDCDCCGETIMGQAMCDACVNAGCEGGDRDCQVECTHENFYTEDGIRICEDCGFGEDGSQHRRLF